MTIYTLLSCSVEGPIAGLFARDPNVRKSRLSEGAKMGEVVVRDVRRRRHSSRCWRGEISGKELARSA
jgi:hypothetical protein